MFLATFKDTKNMKYLTDALSELAEDAHIIMNGEGIRIEAADPSLICKVEAFFSRGEFTEYEAEGEKKAAIDVESLAKVTRRIRHADVIHLSLEEGLMRVSLAGEVRRDFHNALIEPHQEELPRIDVEYSVRLEMDSSVFREIVKDVAAVGNNVLLCVDEHAFSLTTEGDTGKVRIDIPRENPAIKRLDYKMDCMSKFNLGYLLSFLRASFISEVVVLQFGNKEIPLKLLFPSEGGTFVAFYLAPMEF